MAAAAAAAGKLIERMLAIFGRCSEIVMGRTSPMGRTSRESPPDTTSVAVATQWDGGWRAVAPTFDRDASSPARGAEPFSLGTTRTASRRNGKDATCRQ